MSVQHQNRNRTQVTVRPDLAARRTAVVVAGQMSMAVVGTVRAVRDWVVAADDRTGAFEVAALIADVVGPTLVTVGAPADGSCVVAIASRALPADEAATRASAKSAT